MNAYSAFAANATILPVEFVIEANHSSNESGNDVVMVEIGDVKLVYWPECTTFYELKHPSKDVWLNIFVPNGDIDYKIMAEDPTRYKPDLSDPRVQNALA